MGTRIEVTGRRGRRSKQLVDDLKETKRCWKLRKLSLGKAMNLSQYRLCDDDLKGLTRTVLLLFC